MNKILQNIQIEVDASFLYSILADNEEDANVMHVFKEMSEIEKSHALGRYQWHWENGFLLKVPKNCMKIKCNLKWKS